MEVEKCVGDILIADTNFLGTYAYLLLLLNLLQQVKTNFMYYQCLKVKSIYVPLSRGIIPIFPTIREYDIWHVSLGKYYPSIGTPWSPKNCTLHSSNLASQESEPCIFLRWLPMLCCNSPIGLRKRMQMTFLPPTRK